jgi:hypothetical protein
MFSERFRADRRGVGQFEKNFPQGLKPHFILGSCFGANEFAP